MTATDPAAPLGGEGRWVGWLERLNAPRDGAGLGAYRVLLGALLLFSVARFWSYGWIEQLYIQPSFHFTYLGFGWVKPWPGAWMYVHFAVLGVAALCLCIGFHSRLSALLFGVTFTYAELIEKASYLNHYYFVSLVTLLLATMPCGACFSVDAALRRRRGEPAAMARTWCYALLRTQLAILYFFAGLAKLNPDWLLDAQPLRTWLSLHADAPWIGAWLAAPATAYVASYAGALFDLTIPAWLSFPRTRPYAYATVLAFHVGVWLLFPIGVFSWVMIASTTLFFEASWPRRLLRAGPGPAEARASGRLTAAGAGLIAGYLLLQLGTPLRYLLYPGNVNWHEQGFRFAWRVMLIEKAGQVEFNVVTDADDKRFVVYPRELLTPLQYKMMSTQPDMIQEFAGHLKQRFEAQGHARVRVYATAWASLNGRPRQRLIDPAVDLGSVPRSLAPKSWILPLQNSS
jgi:vitamin K-dependent gamma-carboxylase